MTAPSSSNLLDRLIEDAQADDYVLAGTATRRLNGRDAAVAGMVLLLIGLLLGVALSQRVKAAPSAQQQREQLVAQIDEQRQQVDASARQVAGLRASVSQLQRLASGGLSADFADQLRSVEIASGFVALSGPGAVLTLQDAAPPLPKGVDPEESRVLDVDMQAAVNGLWEAGAQAVAVNDIRLTSATAIRTAGEAIMVDYRPLVPPYRITALGPADLQRGFGKTWAARELESLRRQYGIQSEIVAVDRARVPASTANLPVRAEVDRGEDQ